MKEKIYKNLIQLGKSMDDMRSLGITDLMFEET